ncbi:fatty acyl-CoA reductase 1-like protein, partial [Dinothrombium tinctorium]
RKQSPEKAIKQLLSSKLFKFHTYSSTQREKIVALEGDLCEVGLGLSESNRRLIQDNVNIVFHITSQNCFTNAVSFFFKQDVIGTQNLMNFTKSMKNLQCFVHVSTIYSNCNQKFITEEVEPLSNDTKTIIENLRSFSPQSLESEAYKYFDGRPDGYTFSKALCENIVNESRENVPTAIVRPAIIAPAIAEPCPGFVNQFEPISGFLTFLGLGILQIVDYDFSIHTEYTPVDYLANILITVAYKIANSR